MNKTHWLFFAFDNTIFVKTNTLSYDHWSTERNKNK
jgi:hypothetical protein